MSINSNVEKELVNIETIVNDNDAVCASLASILLLAPVGTGTRGNAALICSVAENDFNKAHMIVTTKLKPVFLRYGKKTTIETVCERYNLEIASPVIEDMMTTSSFDGSDKGEQSHSPNIMYHLDNLNCESGLALRDEVLDAATDEAKAFFDNLDYDPLRVVDGADLSEDEWHERRKICIGASEVSAILGSSPFTNNVDLWHQKLGDEFVVDDPEEEKRRKELIFEWGHICETYLRALIASIPMFEGCKVFVETEVFSNEKYPFLTCNLDAMLLWPDGHWSILEFKAPSEHTVKHYKDGAIPEYYQQQMQEQMFLTNVDDAYLIALFGRDTYTVSHLVRDLDVQMEIVQECADFWNGNVMAQIEPEPNGSGEALIKTIRHYKGKGNPSAPPITLGEAQCAQSLKEAEEYKRQMAELSAKSKEIEKKYKDAIAPILYQMGAATYATCEDTTNGRRYVIKYTETPDSPKLKKADLEKLKREQPDTYSRVAPYLSYSGGGRRVRLESEII